jgi:hypothetical protein
VVAVVVCWKSANRMWCRWSIHIESLTDTHRMNFAKLLFCIRLHKLGIRGRLSKLLQWIFCMYTPNAEYKVLPMRMSSERQGCTRSCIGKCNDAKSQVHGVEEGLALACG